MYQEFPTLGALSHKIILCQIKLSSQGICALKMVRKRQNTAFPLCNIYYVAASTPGFPYQGKADKRTEHRNDERKSEASRTT